MSQLLFALATGYLTGFISGFIVTVVFIIPLIGKQHGEHEE